VIDKRVVRLRPVKAVSLGVLAVTLAGQTLPAAAQDTLAEARLRKIEAEVRAMQRVVFPGADGKVFTPQITQGTSTAAAVGQPATSAVTDILTRLDSVEAQMARLTGQIEQNGNRISQIEARLGIGASAPPAAAAEGAAAGAAPAAAATAAAATPAAASATTTPAPAAPAPTPAAAAVAPKPAPVAGPRPTATAAAKPAAPSADRVRAVRAIEKPQTDDPGDDEYSYGFRLWEAKFFPEAQQQLKLFVDKYPKHPRISFGRNLLGRAYLDDGKPREAAQWFLQNYQADKKGGRAADSLLYLGVAMKELKDTKRACIALSEFAEVYAAEATGRLKGTYDATRNGLKCS